MKKLLILLMLLLVALPAWADPVGEDLIKNRVADCSPYTTEGDQCWRTDTDTLYIGTGSAAQAVGGSTSVTTSDTTTTDNEICRMDGTGGKTIQGTPTTPPTISDTGAITINTVTLTGDGDGALTISGDGDGSDEDLTINLDDVSNVIDLTSSTGVTTLDLNSISLVTDGKISGYVYSASAGASCTIGTDCDGTSQQVVHGGILYVTGAATVTLPAVTAGMAICVYTVGAVAVSVDANAADRIRLDGTALDDGDKITNASTSGDFICLHGDSADGWTTWGRSGTWTDGG